MESLNSQVVASLQNSPLKVNKMIANAGGVDLRKNLNSKEKDMGRNTSMPAVVTDAGRTSAAGASSNANRIFDEASLLQEQDS
mmetsp:Transcript_33099/g.40978  ORF Transcript_33099/g.40978 Transcript_33099/m.40978 type:complete len:83 (-) Transcript_33099:649-897(-)